MTEYFGVECSLKAFPFKTILFLMDVPHNMNSQSPRLVQLLIVCISYLKRYYVLIIMFSKDNMQYVLPVSCKFSLTSNF